MSNAPAITTIASRWTAIGLVVIGLAACAVRPEESVEIRSILPMEAVDPHSPLGKTGGGQQTARAENDGVHTILALSAGGAEGAYGAGVLAGWTASGKRPTFDVVTGVSTGALQAVLAFLGPRYDPLLKQFYTTLDSEDVFRDKGIGGIFGDSLYDNEPLKRQIEKVVTPKLLQEVAAEHDKGRRLYVATTNLDAGELTVWDMGRIAKGGRTNTLLHFQKVLRASAAVPGFFEPVYIKPQRGVQLRQAHVDGGVKAPVLVTRFMFQSKAGKKALYMVINGTTARLNDANPIKPNLADISRKTIVELMRQVQKGAIYRDYVLARKSGATFRITSVPDSFPISNAMLEFDPERMRQLYEVGYQVGAKGPSAWSATPRDINAEERVASR